MDYFSLTVLKCKVTRGNLAWLSLEGRVRKNVAKSGL